MTQRLNNQHRWVPLTMVLGTATAYELAFVPLHQTAGDVIAVFTVIPVAVAGWLLGARAGLVAGLLGSALNTMNFTLVEKIGWEVVMRWWPAVLASLALGVMAGWAGERAAHAKRESRESNEERDTFFDLSMDLLCIAGTDGYFKRLNPAWERALGFSREALCSKPFIEFVHPDDRARTQEVMEKLSRGEPAINFENRYRCHDGSYRWLTWITPAPEQGAPMLYAAARDITERKHMEQALRQANEELGQRVGQQPQELEAANAALRVARARQRDLIEAIAGIVWECDVRTWKFSFVSRHAELVLGYPVWRWLDEPDFWYTHIHPDDRDWVMEYCLVSSREKRKYSFEYRMLAADGRIVWLQDIVTMVPDEQGPATLRGIMVDITERKQTEAALRESEARFRSLFEEVPIAYQSLDIEGRYIDVNNGLCTLLGYSPDELQGKPFDDFWAPEVRQFFPVEFGSFKRDGRTTKHLRLKRKDGMEIAVILEGRVQRDPMGNFLRTHCILTDVTDQKLIEEDLRRSEVFIDSVLENLPNMIFVKDAENLRFVRFNKAGEKLLGYRRDELLGKNDYDCFPKEEADFFTLKDREVLRSVRLLDIPEEPIQTKDNGVRLLHTKKIPICTPDGTPQYLLGISEDITERKQAEEALRESEERLRQAIRASNIGIFDHDHDRNTIYWSREHRRIYGLDSEEPVTLAMFLQYVHAEDRDRITEAVRRAHDPAGDGLFDVEHRIVDRQGVIHWLSTRSRTHFEGEGPARHKVRTTGAVVDITERQQAAEALHESEARFQAFMNHSPAVTFIKDEHGRYVYINHTYERLFGITLAEASGKTDLAWLPETVVARLRENDLTVLSSNQPLEIEETVPTPCGKVNYWLVLKFPLTNASGHRFVGGVAMDITERKRAEEALRVSRERFELAVRGTNDGIWDWDILTNENYWSDRWYELLGYQPGDLIPSYDTWASLLHPDDRERVLERARQHIEQRVPYDLEYRMGTKEGTYRWFHAKGQAVWNALGLPVRMAGSISDVTDRKEAEEALRKSEEQLRAVLEEREQLSQDLHDNIIQAVYAVGMSLEECRYLFQEDHVEAEKKLEHAVANLNRVISDVRMYIVWEKPKEITGQQLCTELAELALTMESSRGIYFSLDLDAETAQRLTPLGAFHVLHIAQEAMSNSLRHSQSRRGLVSLRMEDGRIRLEVSDDGIGFNLKKASGQGHGLQNMTARAHKLGANFQIISRPGSGTQILVELPLEDQHAGASS